MMKRLTKDELNELTTFSGQEVGVSDNEWLIYRGLMPLYESWLKLLKSHKRNGNVCQEWRARGRKSFDGWYAFALWSCKSGYRPENRLMRIIKEAGWHPENCTWVDDLEYKFLKRLIAEVRIPSSIHDYDLSGPDGKEAIRAFESGVHHTSIARALKLEPRKISIGDIKKGLKHCSNDTKKHQNEATCSDKFANPPSELRTSSSKSAHLSVGNRAGGYNKDAA